jgi:hypothetical protein
MSITTPGATVSLQARADLARAAAQDMGTLASQALLAAALALTGTVTSTVHRRGRRR